MKQINYFLLLCLLSMVSSFLFAQSPNWKLINSQEYPTQDIGVASYNVMEHGADNTGESSSQQIFQTLLNKLGAEGGGTLFVPAGKYKLTYGLVIPKGVTLRGEWKKPVKGQPIEGTILMASETRIEGYESESYGFIIMEPSTAVTHLSIWYPNQNPDKIKKFPPTIVYGRQGVWGNDYCNVRHVTLVNSYSGIVLSRTNGGGCPNIHDVYGTPLSRGIEIDNIADVGRFDWIDFSPEYWAGSGLPGAPAKGSAYADWMYKNGTGIIMRRNDWSYTCFATIEGYKIGFHAGYSKVVSKESDVPNGHNYGLTFNGCETGVFVEAIAESGMMFTRVKTTDCENGVVVAPGTSGILDLYNCELNAKTSALKIDELASTKVLTQQCTFNSGKVNASGGIFTASDCDFKNAIPHVFVGSNARVILTGNRANGTLEIENKSMFECAIDKTPVNIKLLPSFPEIKEREAKPSRTVLYNVFDYGAKADAVTDNTQFIQNALNKASADGGGIVFLPPGKYKVLGNLTVPPGVELKGASDISTVPRAQGSILEVYADKDNEAGQPFLKLSQGSGVRGISFNYPEQVASQILPDKVHKYPYCMQITGSDVYIINVGLRATYHGLDMFTYKCDNHYIDYLAGHVFTTGMHVGGGTENGLICNVQFNTIVYSSGAESKFGSWPNSPDQTNQTLKDACYKYNWDHLNFMILDNCKNQTLYNNFHYGSYRGIIFGSGNPTGISLGTAIDASRKAVLYEGLGSSGFDLINSQIVSIKQTNSNGTTQTDTRYIETAPGFTGEATLFNANFWGGTYQAIEAGGGTLNLMVSNFRAAGESQFAKLSGEANLNIHNSFITPKKLLNVTGAEPRVSVESAIVDPTGIVTDNCKSWKNNLTVTEVFNDNVLMERTGWTATASHNNSNARNALDGIYSTRWDTGGPQTSGQWFAVDMKTPQQINKVILNTSNSPNDAPAAYKVYLSDDGKDWGSPVASGTTNASVLIVSFPTTTTRHIKIEQTGTKTNYWSIHEFYTAYVDGGTSINTLNNGQIQSIYYNDGMLYLYGFDMNESWTMEIFNVSGQKILTSIVDESIQEVNGLQKGLYIVSMANGKCNVRAKIYVSN